MTSSRSQTVLSATALAYAGSTVFSSYVAVRDNVPGEPFGITAPFSVRTALVVGWGAGIAPPWFMPLTALLAAHRAKGGRPGPAAVASTIGLASIVGHLIEPVTRRPGTWTPATAASITLTLTASTSLAIAGYARYIYAIEPQRRHGNGPTRAVSAPSLRREDAPGVDGG